MITKRLLKANEIPGMQNYFTTSFKNNGFTRKNPCVYVHTYIRENKRTFKL